MIDTHVLCVASCMSEVAASRLVNLKTTEGNAANRHKPRHKLFTCFTRVWKKPNKSGRPTGRNFNQLLNSLPVKLSLYE